MGYVTIKNVEFGMLQLRIPNHVVWELYMDFFTALAAEEGGLDMQAWDSRTAMYALARQGDMRPLAAQMEDTLRQLSNRDTPGFDEKHVKLLFVALVHQAGLFHIRSEHEAGRQFVDILLLRKPGVRDGHQFALEFKYLKKAEAGQATAVLAGARKQMEGYLRTDSLRGLDCLRAFVLVFVNDRCFACEEVQV